jgi:4-amino-4-deoxy-L-arabinose transferase
MKIKKIYIFLFIYFVLFLIPLKDLPLFETTDARYAEISREMVENKNYIEPVFNGIKHFHKPPFTYWINAIGIKLFGVNDFSVRFFGMLSAVIILFVTLKLSKILLIDEEKSINSVYILSSSILFIGVSKVVSTDIYLTLFTICSQYFLFKQIYQKKSTINSIMYGIFLGLGFLTKGPIIFLFTILPFLISKIFLKSHRKVFSIKEIILAIIFFSLISLPWYIAIIIKNPKLLDYFIKVQTIERIATNRFHREKPFYYFALIFILTFFPFVIVFIKDLYKKIKRKEELSLYLYIIIPFIVFSFSKSKLPTYILPFYPLASILVAQKLDKDTLKLEYFKIPSLIFSMLLPLIFASSPFIFNELKTQIKIILTFFIISTITFINLYKNFSLRNLSIHIIISSFLAYLIIPIIASDIKGFKKMAETINLIDPEKKYEVLTYKSFIPSISFYRQKITVSAFGRERETYFENDNNYKKYYIETKEELIDFFKKNDKFFVVTKDNYINEITEYGFSCTKKFTQKYFSLYLCIR